MSQRRDFQSIGSSALSESQILWRGLGPITRNQDPASSCSGARTVLTCTVSLTTSGFCVCRTEDYPKIYLNG